MDINECEFDNGGCSNNTDCMNTPVKLYIILIYIRLVTISCIKLKEIIICLFTGLQAYY